MLQIETIRNSISKSETKEEITKIQKTREEDFWETGFRIKSGMTFGGGDSYMNGGDRDFTKRRDNAASLHKGDQFPSFAKRDKGRFSDTRSQFIRNPSSSPFTKGRYRFFNRTFGMH